ncbi:anion permease [Naumannella halotolerans]|uniref:DASS family divalent anion:Na+ symporter n=1 Tax=Naumannella halotolerans TaxID=993414 RepID=A0A4R7J940_9ACTN|nr:anion permease [Naumannella halotolerans]TDT33814.1 DASS family divalent anion:Na+ symporter [Naumannella halotolerans]
METDQPATQSSPRFDTSFLWKFAVMVAVALAIYFIPPPAGVDPRGMHMLAIFVATILGLILQPLPTPSIAIIGLAVAMITGAMDVGEGEALAGFANATVLLIVAAFFIADGFLLTGLGRRIALIFVSWIGKSPLGIAYGMAVTDLVLAPATPSNTARAGGVVYPIIRSISEVQGSTPDSDESRRKLGSYLTLTAAHVNVITSAMFVTAMAGNPVAQEAAAGLGVEITWGGWALAAIVPGILSLLAVPWVMTLLYRPTATHTPDAPEMARTELRKMGRMSHGEMIMAGTFVLLLGLWIAGSSIGVNATAAAFVGIAILLLTRVLTWKDMARNASAWNTFIFFAVLVGMAAQLNTLGVIDWIGSVVSGLVGGMPWVLAFAILSLVYFYVHYLFASNTAQIVAMYAVFVGAAITAGAPPMFAALVFGFIGNLFGALSHYASGPSAVIYGSGYVKVGEWFRIAFAMSIVIILIWTITGGAWMYVLGMWEGAGPPFG